MPSFGHDHEPDYQEDETETISDGTGGTVEVTYHNNGRSTVHWGGMGGDTEYDENGEEC